MLSIAHLAVRIDEHTVLDNINLDVDAGTVHVLMGPNGSGKSSLAYALMGHPRYVISRGSLIFNGEDITHLSPDKRAQHGLFLAAQHQFGLSGVQVFDFLRQASRALHGVEQEVDELYDAMCDYMDLLGLDQSFAYRSVHEGFSGGEKKRFELLQVLLFKPRMVILDEIDSGLDLDGQKMIIEALAMIQEQVPHTAFLIISHNPHFIKHLQPQAIHIMKKGVLIKSGNKDVLDILHVGGYETFYEEQKVT